MADYETLTFKLELTDKHDRCDRCEKLADLVLVSYYGDMLGFHQKHETSGVEMCLKCAKPEFEEATNEFFELVQNNIDHFKSCDGEEKEE